MEKNNSIIKIGTLTLFIGLIIGFVALKSGCISAPLTKEISSETKRTKLLDVYASLDTIRTLDTIRILESENYAITKKLKIIPSSKSVILVSHDEIYSLLHKDSVPENFRVRQGGLVTPEEYEKYWNIRKRK